MVPRQASGNGKPGIATALATFHRAFAGHPERGECKLIHCRCRAGLAHVLGLLQSENVS